MTDSLARMIAPRMAVATSLEHLTPRPTWPLLSPMATKALKRVRCPALVCFCTGMIFSTSSFRADPRKKSMISCSCKRQVSSLSRYNRVNCSTLRQCHHDLTNKINDIYLDGKREEVDVFQGFDLHVLDQATKFGHWNPLKIRHIIQK